MEMDYYIAENNKSDVEVQHKNATETVEEEEGKVQETKKKIDGVVRVIKELSNVCMISSNSSLDNNKTFPIQENKSQLKLIEQEITNEETNNALIFPTKNTNHYQNIKKINFHAVKSEVEWNYMNTEYRLQFLLKNDVRSDLGKSFLQPQEIDEISVESNEPLNSCNPSSSTSSASSFNAISNLNDNPKTKYKFNFHNKIYLYNSSTSKETSKENNGVFPLEECIFNKGLSTDRSSDKSDSNSETESSDSFVEDSQDLNPEMLFNVILNNYCTKLELLVQKILKMPDDVTVISECMILPPIPENEHKPKMFTSKEIKNFENGIPEYEYEIDSDNWHKIMVKCATMIIAHAGFSTANEQSMYVLADVGIDYIKKLAVIMKNNFDNQEDHSYSYFNDPINTSLIQIGANGGLAELIKHYKNDVFGRRDRLIEKCQNFHIIIDKYIDQQMIALNTNTQSYTKDYFVQENPASDTFMMNEEIKLDEDEADREISSEIEVVDFETQSMSVENTLNTNHLIY